jgi:hypothetical protein
VATEKIREEENISRSGSKPIWLVKRGMQDTEREAARNSCVSGPWLLSMSTGVVLAAVCEVGEEVNVTRYCLEACLEAV